MESRLRRQPIGEWHVWCCPNCRRELRLRGSCTSELTSVRCDECGLPLREKDGIICLAPGLAHSTDGFDPIFFEMLKRIEETNFWFVNRARLIVTLLSEHFPAAESILEIGCGTGSVLLALRRAIPKLRLVGSELHTEGLKIAHNRLSDVLLLQMDARKIPAREEFDVIGAFDVLEHIAEDDVVLEQVYGALKPKGGLLVSVPQHPWLWSQSDDVAHHVRRYRRGEMEQKLTSSGFRILRSTSFTSILLPVMMASRLLEWCRRQGNPMAELQVSGWINRVLSTALGVELALTKRGLDWPIGGSRIIVAQRI